LHVSIIFCEPGIFPEWPELHPELPGEPKISAKAGSIPEPGRSNRKIVINLL